MNIDANAQQVGGNYNFEHDPIDLSRVNPGVAAHVESVDQSFQDRIADLQQQMAGSDDPARNLELKDEIMRLENAFDDFKGQVDRFSLNVGGFAGRLLSAGVDRANQAIAPQLQQAVSEFRQVLADSYNEFGTAEIPPQTFCGTMADRFPVALDVAQMVGVNTDRVIDHIDLLLEKLEGGKTEEVAEVSGTDSASGSESTSASESTSGSEGTSSSEGSSGSGSSEGVSDVKVGDMMALLDNDPDAFRAALSEMGTEERSEMMVLVQQQLQQINQMFTMMSQFSQAMHDTSKAVINNLRV